MKNNKGFSLVELIVSFAILAIAGVAVYGLMSTSTSHFTRTGSDVGLQYEQQVVVNRLRDVLMGASDALSYDDATKTLVIYSQEDLGPLPGGGVGHTYKYNVTKIYLNGEQLKQVSKLFDTIADVDATTLVDADASLLGESVKDVSFDLSDIAGGKIGFTIWFEDDGRELSSKQVVSLRNKVLNSDNPTEIFTTSSGFMDSFIRYITIYRNEVALTPSDTSEIALTGANTVRVKFDYRVTANEYSDRTYNCVWSLVNDIDGWSVDSNGFVEVDKTKVSAGDVNVLKVTSVDDITKYQTVNLRIVDDGYYPISLSVATGDFIDYVGYREYDIHPIITYQNSHGVTYTENSGTLCTWVVEAVNEQLPAGCVFDPATGKFTALPTANGMTVRFTATMKAPCSDGTYLTDYVELAISDVGDYKPNQKLTLHGPASIYNCRGQDSIVTAKWENSTSTKFVYHWRVTPYDNGSWDSTGTDTSKFSKIITISGGTDANKLTGEDDGFYASKEGFGYLYVNSKSWLDWKKTYKVKVECYATDDDGKKYGLGNETDNNYQGPVEMLVEYEPVKIILRPTSYVKTSKEGTNDKKFVASQDLKRSSTGKLNEDKSEYLPNYSLYGGNTVRTFEIFARGVIYSGANTAALTVSKADFHFEGPNKNVITNEGIKDFFDDCDYVSYPNNTVAFEVSMNSDDFKTYYKQFEQGGTGFYLNRPTKMIAVYKASDDHHNNVDVHYLVGDNYMSDDDLEVSTKHKFDIIYNPLKLNDENYIEVIK